MLRIASISVGYQEVVGETSLVVFFSGCDVGCEGCHSEEFWDSSIGRIVSEPEFRSKLERHESICSCVTFMGGEWDEDILASYVKISKDMGFKVCLYTGRELDEISEDLTNEFDYIKTGPYVEDLGGLNSAETNQRMYQSDKDDAWSDITELYFEDDELDSVCPMY